MSNIGLKSNICFTNYSFNMKISRTTKGCLINKLRYDSLVKGRCNVNIDKKKFGEFIFKLRKEKGMTQKELADQLHVTKQAISKWECGICYPDIVMFECLARAFDISTYELLNGEKVPDNFVYPQQQIKQTFSQFICSCKNDLSYKLKKYRIRFIVLLVISCLFVLLIIHNNIKAPTFSLMRETYSQNISSLSKYNGLVCEQEVEYTGNVNEEIAKDYIRAIHVKEGTIARHVKFYRKKSIYSFFNTADGYTFEIFIYMNETGD